MPKAATAADANSRMLADWRMMTPPLLLSVGLGAVGQEDGASLIYVNLYDDLERIFCQFE
jgi:hypothetical protein